MIHTRFRWCLVHRFFYTTQKGLTPTMQLDQLQELALNVNQTTSNLKKQAMVRGYPSCHSILKRIFDPHSRFYISSKRLLAYMEQQASSQQLVQIPKARAAAAAAAATTATTTSAATTTLESLLDTLSSRQLTGTAALEAAASFYRTYCKTPSQQQIFCRVLDRSLKMGLSVKMMEQLFDKDPLSSSMTSNTLPFRGVALATTSPNSKYPLDNGEWYASRKLDGIRCIVVIKDNQDIQFYSRTGRPFDSLGKVREAIQERCGVNKATKDIVLDGEICVYGKNQAKEGLEDFLTALRQIRTRGQTMPDPVYEVFDLVDRAGFSAGKDPALFCERQQRLVKLLGKPHPNLRVVPQTHIQSTDDLRKMEAKALSHGWEGLILRRDAAYQGKRSRDMVKIKRWQDEEYIVKSIETGMMRMPDTGEEKEVMTSAVIEHKGSLVGVGSGFTIQQRLRYKENPDLVVGKPITVQYFSESISESGQPSLRFPVAKTVYEDGKRDV